ncbi:MAG: hypothetical protein NWF04_05705 [Candidatus Bathyarchaeota archaeon]|nr:hypothetical protein [Candidatus Bathyarchaeota archaeon]
MSKDIGQGLSREQTEKIANQLKAIRSNPEYRFDQGKSAYTLNRQQVEGIKQVAELVKSSLPASSAKNAVMKLLDSEVSYFQQISELNQRRNVQIKELSTVIIGPDGRSIIPFAPLPMSKMLLVGWDKEGNEVYYNTDDGYYYTRDSAGGNTFTRFNGNYMDDNGTLHSAEREAQDCGFWQYLYRKFGFDDEHLKFPDSIINTWDLKNKVRPDNNWFE